jgi:tRNA threonylcarbamoyladenosine biosynthesis protein TsaE
MKIDSYSAEDTYQLGFTMGSEAKKGEVYCLSGDLGVGKTVFTQGFARGIGIIEAVSSPTFTIFKNTIREGFLFTILMYIVSLILMMQRS